MPKALLRRLELPTTILWTNTGCPWFAQLAAEMAAAVQSTEDFAEGVASFVERRAARFTGR